MSKKTWPPEGVSGREREILDIVYRRGAVTATDVRRELRDAPVHGAVRTMLRRLESKGHITHKQDGPRFVYEPTVEAVKARELALDWLARTFFEGSAAKAAAAALDRAATDLSDSEIQQLSALVDAARRNAHGEME